MNRMFLCIALLTVNLLSAQNVAINTDGTVANSSAILDVKSNSKGILVPRMTTAQRTVIVSPAAGLLVYDTDTNSFWFFNGNAWTNLAGPDNASDGTNWLLSGNSGTTPLSDFIGTTDNQPLMFKVNNSRAGFLNLNGSVFWGTEAGMNSTGSNNVAIGTRALYHNISHNNLVAIGDSALFHNGIGATYFDDGIENSAIGSKALFSNTTGARNIALGYKAMFSNTVANDNLAIGVEALSNNTTGYENTAVGNNSLRSNIIGAGNTAFGPSTLRYNTGNFNSAFGTHALIFNTTGHRNTAVGRSALFHNTTGYENTAVGEGALTTNYTGYQNTAIGRQAMFSNYSGIYNTAVGFSALIFNIAGTRNTVLGAYAMYQNNEGERNVALGYQSLNANESGDQNVAIGVSALTVNVTGSNNTAVGYNADVTANNLSNATAIGYNATVNANNKVVIGNSSVTSIGGYTNWSNFSDGRFKQNVKEDVPGLAFINKLRPVTYTLNVDGINAFNSKDFPAEKKQVTVNPDKKNIVYTGFMAQEVEQAAKSLNYNFSGIDKPKDDNKQTYALRYSDFVVPLVKAIQEQQKIIEDMRREIEELKQRK
ncbi:MAG TPA: tail fiber domain-containing protein [Chitinophagaceae bacterium]|nr:tail fiber domain-containing protein [Chitinophagaceae bacterium]